MYDKDTLMGSDMKKGSSVIFRIALDHLTVPGILTLIIVSKLESL